MAGRIARLFLVALSLGLMTGCAGLITSAASGLADNLALPRGPGASGDAVVGAELDPLGDRGLHP